MALAVLSGMWTHFSCRSSRLFFVAALAALPALLNCNSDVSADNQGASGFLTLAGVSLQTVGQGRFVGAQNNGGGAVLATATIAQAWEKFTLTDINGGSLASGDTVFIQAGNGQFFQAVNGGGSTLNAGSNNQLGWETFKIVKQTGTGVINNGDVIGLEASGGNWVSAQNGGGGTIFANGGALGQWEQLKISGLIVGAPASPPAMQPAPQPPGPSSSSNTLTPVTFKTQLKGNFIGAQNNGGGAVIATATVAQNWETFSIIDINGGALNSGDSLFIRAGNGQFFQALNGGGTTVNAGSNIQLGWETFKIVKQAGVGTINSGDVIGLQASSGAWVSAANGGGGTVFAYGGALGSWESLIVSIGGAGGSNGGSGGSAGGSGPSANTAWVGTWAVSPQGGGDSFQNKTLRQIVHTSISGTAARVQLSNAFGNRSIDVSDVHIARRTSGSSVDTATDRPVLFGGQSKVSIQPGAVAISDSVDFQAPALSDVAVSFYLVDSSGANTFHQQATQTNYVASGDVSASRDLPNPGTLGSYYLLANMDVKNSAALGAVATLGASITDGIQSNWDANRRWPNDLAARLNSAGVVVGVLNQGISGNRLLQDGAGQSAINRFTRDVINQPGIKWVIFSDDPINDLGAGSGRPNGAQLITGLTQLINAAHQAGIRFLCSTLTPFEGAGGWSPEGETARGQVDDFIRSPNSGCDGVLDQDVATHDPGHPTRYWPANDAGDHLHPNEAGLQAIAGAVNLALFH